MELKFKKKVEEIRELIGLAKEPIMFFDLDTDGSTSYLQLKRVFPKLKGFPMDKDIVKQKRVLENYFTDDIDLVIIFDIPFLTDEFLNLIKSKKIIWTDHHPTNDPNLIEKYNIIHLNPLNYDKFDNRPSCFLSYLITNNLNNLDLVALGSVSDFFLLEVFVDFYNFDRELFKRIFRISDEKRDEIFEFINKYKFNDKRVIRRREDYIRFLSYESGVGILKNFFDFICKLKEYSDTVKSFRLLEKMSLIDILAEISAAKTFPFEGYASILLEYKKRLSKVLLENEEDFFIYEYRGKISFAKTLSEELNYKFTNSKVVGVCFRKLGKDWYSCSFRGKGVIVNKVISDALSGLNGRGGGHPYAAGVSIHKNDFAEFKKRILKKFNEIN